jgi:hypothetical protein
MNWHARCINDDVPTAVLIHCRGGSALPPTLVSRWPALPGKRQRRNGMSISSVQRAAPLCAAGDALFVDQRVEFARFVHFHHNV